MGAGARWLRPWTFTPADWVVTAKSISTASSDSRSGPARRHLSVLLANQFPEVLVDLRVLADSERPAPFAPQFAYRNPGRDPGTQLDRIEQRIWEALALFPRQVGEVARTGRGSRRCAGWSAVDLRQLLRSLRVMRCMCSANRAVGMWRQPGSVPGYWQLKSATRPPGKERATPESLCERTYQHVVRAAARVILETALAHDPGVEAKNGRWGPLGGPDRQPG